MFNFELSGSFTPIFLLISFAGGLLSSLSPCALGILPIVVSYVGISREQSLARSTLQAISLVLGLGAVLSIVGVICALSGKVLTAIGGDWWILIVASLILLFGLCLLGVMDLNFPALIKRMPAAFSNHPYLYPFIVGAAFALASAPCSTPILASILAFAALGTNVAVAALMLLLFSLGQGAVLVLAAFFTSLITKARNFERISEWLMKICGVALVFVAFYIYWNVFSQFFPLQ